MSQDWTRRDKEKIQETKRENNVPDNPRMDKKRQKEKIGDRKRQ